VRGKLHEEEGKPCEDSVLVVERPGPLLAAVADGLGKKPGGNVASELGVSVFNRVGGSLTSLADPGSFGQSLLQTAKEEMGRRAEEDESLKEMMTTLTGLVIMDDGALIAHIGDSRAYALWRGGAFGQLTVDHNAETDPQWIEVFGSWPGSRQMTRCLAIGEYLGSPDLIPVPDLCDVVSFLLTTDGLHGRLFEQEIANEMRRTASIEDRCNSLLGLALKQGSDDDLAVVIVERQY
jgi:protein phosphatase